MHKISIQLLTFKVPWLCHKFFCNYSWLFVLTAAFLFLNLNFVLMTLLILWHFKKLTIFVRTTLPVRRLWSTLCTRFRFNYWLSKSFGSVISFFVTIYDYLFWQPHFCHWTYISSLRFAWFYDLRVNCLFLLEELSYLKGIRVICVHDFDSILDSQCPLALSYIFLHFLIIWFDSLNFIHLS